MGTDHLATIVKRFLIGGVLVLAFGLFRWLDDAGDADPRVWCDDELMTPGTTCISTDSRYSGTYEERVARRQEEIAESVRNEVYDLPILLVGVATVVGSSLVLVLRARRPTDRGPVTADRGWWSEDGDVR